MKSTEIRNLTTEELNTKVNELKEELFTLRFQHAAGQLENTARIKEIRKTVARIKTIVSERELNK